MDLLNTLFPFNDFILPLTLQKINKHYFGSDEIHLDSGKELYDYLVSPADTFFMRVESDDYENLNIFYGDVIVVERSHLKYEGPAIVMKDNDLVIRVVENAVETEFSYWGTIAYVLKSEEEDFLDMVGQELFVVL